MTAAAAPARRRKFPKVTQEQDRWLRLIAQDRLLLTFFGKAKQYSAAGHVVPEKIAAGLIQSQAVLPLDRGLLRHTPQSWRVRRPEDGA